MKPSFFNFFKAWLLHTYASVAGFKTLASPELAQVRFRRCVGCQFHKEGICLKCGCLIEAKVLLATEKCPIGKWRRVWIRQNTSKKG